MNGRVEDQEFQKINFAEQGLPAEVFEYCQFYDCDFSKANLSNIEFVECDFERCNWSNVLIGNTALKSARYIDCKMLGVKFEDCNPFLLEMQFTNCQLDLSSFQRLQLKGIRFNQSSLKDVDFYETDLTEAIFYECDLHQAAFDRSNLEKVDFTTAYNFMIDPERNRLKKAKFSKTDLEGLLTKYDLVLK